SETNDGADFALVLPAPAHTEPQGEIAELVEHGGWRAHLGAFRIRAEAVQYQKRGAPGARRQTVGQGDHAMQAQAGRFEADNLFFQATSPPLRRGTLTKCPGDGRGWSDCRAELSIRLRMRRQRLVLRGAVRPAFTRERYDNL